MPADLAQSPGGRAGHAVRFYGSEGELASSAGRHLAGGLEAGAIAIAIATPPHRAAMRARMAAYCDPAGARARGDLVVLDADEMLRLFLIGSHPDPGGFDLIIGGLIRRAATAGRPVRLYGEMVAVLWDAGHTRAAIELEGLWNDLGRRLPFSLLCGYPARAVSGAGHAAALQEICDLHGAAVGVPPGTPAP
jgi:MEDS: MEthanogen/methylotroph, DcmR Sensory domain